MYNSLPGDLAEASLTVIQQRNRTRSALLGEAMHAIRHDVLASDAVLAMRFDLEFKNVSATALKLAAKWDSVVFPFRNGNHYQSHLRCSNAVAQGSSVPRVADTFYWVPRRHACMLQWEVLNENICWYLKQSSIQFISDEYADSNSAIVNNSIYVLNTRPESHVAPENHTIRRHGCNTMIGPWSAHRLYQAHNITAPPTIRWADTECGDAWLYS